MSSPVSYSLMAQNINMEDFNRLIEALNEKMLIGFAFTDLTPFTEHDEQAKQAYIDCHGPVNWSTWKDDMIEISRMFPDVRFRLAGSCDYPDDNWHSYFENGKVEECKSIITYEQPVEIQWDKEVF